MGPESTPTTSHILNLPQPSQDTNRPQRRDDVREWMQTVVDSADGGDTRAKGAAETLTMLLYLSSDIGNEEKVKEAICSGEIILKAPPNTETEP